MAVTSIFLSISYHPIRVINPYIRAITVNGNIYLNYSGHFRSTRVPGPKGTRVPGPKGTRVPGPKGTRVPLLALFHKV